MRVKEDKLRFADFQEYSSKSIDNNLDSFDILKAFSTRESCERYSTHLPTTGFPESSRYNASIALSIYGRDPSTMLHAEGLASRSLNAAMSEPKITNAALNAWI